MTARHTLLLLALPLHAAIGQVTQAGAPRDADLERRIEARREELHRFVKPAVWQRVEGASRSMQERIRSGAAGDLVEYARKQVTARLGKLKPAQTDLLAFCILAETARTLSHPTPTDSALAVNSQVDVLQSAALKEALYRDSALMSAASQLLQWTGREGPEILLTVRSN
jgi:hypothetical protein